MGNLRDSMIPMQIDFRAAFLPVPSSRSGRGFRIGLADGSILGSISEERQSFYRSLPERVAPLAHVAISL